MGSSCDEGDHATVESTGVESGMRDVKEVADVAAPAIKAGVDELAGNWRKHCAREDTLAEGERDLRQYDAHWALRSRGRRI